MDVAPDGEVKLMVNVVPDKVALVPVGVPGVLGDPPETTPRTDVPLVEAIVS